MVVIRVKLSLSSRAKLPIVIPSERGESRNRDRPGRGASKRFIVPLHPRLRKSMRGGHRGLRGRGTAFPVVPRPRCSPCPLRMLLCCCSCCCELYFTRSREELLRPQRSPTAANKHLGCAWREAVRRRTKLGLSLSAAPRDQLLQQQQVTCAPAPPSGRSRFLDSLCSLGMTT